MPDSEKMRQALIAILKIACDPRKVGELGFEEINEIVRDALGCGDIPADQL
jgi:hypothetical protein